jgi:hypothetical protein
MHMLRDRKNLSPQISVGLDLVSESAGSACGGSAAGPGMGRLAAGSASVPVGTVAPETGGLTGDLRASAFDGADEAERSGSAPTAEGAEAAIAASSASVVGASSDADPIGEAGDAPAAGNVSGPNCILCGGVLSRTSNTDAASASNTIAARPPTSHTTKLRFPVGTEEVLPFRRYTGVVETGNSGSPQARQTGASSVLTALHSSHTLVTLKPSRVGLVVLDHADKLNRMQAC